MEYTKGQWLLCRNRDGFDIESDSVGSLVANRIEISADAHLIAAAPDMYEALKAAQKLLQKQYEILLGHYPQYGTTSELELANKALAKAEGK